jgi:uncharacterized protein YmfQ (DUF2313 family)
MEQNDYKELFQNLMPKGPAWSHEPDSNMSALSDATAAFFFYIHKRVEKAGGEIFPQSCEETLVDWEYDYGLPEICEHGNHSAGSTFGERRAEVIAKINRKFSPTELNFINLAKILGYEISIKTVPPSICGISRCGEKLGGNISARFYWIVLVHGIKVTYARSGITVCGEPLCHISYAQDLECLFKRIKPAHTIVKFRYV